MRRLIAGLQHLFEELRRRKVYQVAVLYCVAAFGLLQLGDILLPAFGAGDRAVVILVVLIVAGFPAALLAGWMYEWTASGVRRTADASAKPDATPSATVRSLAIVAAAVATALVSIGGWVALDLRHRGSAVAEAASAEIPALDPRRVAVLYFDDHSPDGGLGYLAAGLTESLLHELARVPGLAVSSRNAVRPFRERALPLDSLIGILEVGSLIEGSVTYAGDRVRATVQLIDGRTGSHVDSRVVEGTLDRLFAFQDSVATTVARTLRKRLGRELELRGAREGAAVPEAWVHYQRAQEMVRTLESFAGGAERESVALLLGADSLLAEAERLDPAWPVPTVARVAVANRMAATLAPRPGGADTAWARRTLARADAVLVGDPEQVQALYQRGLLRHRMAMTPEAGPAADHLAAAERDLARATELAPGFPEAWWALSRVLLLQTRFGEAVHAARTALEEDVFLQIEEGTLQALFDATLQLGPTEEAIHWCDEGRRRFPREINFLRCRLLILGTFPQVRPDVEEAHLLMDSILRLASPRNVDTWRMFAGAHVAQTLARAGLPDSARTILRAVRGNAAPPMLGSHEAKVLLLLGDEAEAVRLLRQYLTFDTDTAFLAVDWWFEDLHDYAPFRRLVGLPEDR